MHIVEVGHSFVESMPYQVGSSAQRIRIGLTGLAIAFLLVLLGSVISRSSRETANNAADHAATNEPSEPLAEMGATPGASATNSTDNNMSSTSK